MATAPFPVDPVLTGIVLAYRNRRMIADDVLPRAPAIGKQEFQYSKWDKDEAFTPVDTKVGRRSKPNEVEFTGTTVTDKTEDYGLDVPVPNDDIANASAERDPVGRAAEGAADLIDLGREKRVADLVFAGATYAAANKVTLAGGSQWSVAGSTPIKDILTGLDAPILRPNIMVIGRLAFSQLMAHADIMKAVHGTSGDTGIARRQQIADIFELEDILVGESFSNTAKKGQTASLARPWGKHCALLFRDTLGAGSDTRVTFGWTAQYGDRIAGQQPDSDIGLRGGVRVRVGESVKEVIAAADVGYFIQNAIA